MKTQQRDLHLPDAAKTLPSSGRREPEKPPAFITNLLVQSASILMQGD